MANTTSHSNDAAMTANNTNAQASTKQTRRVFNLIILDESGSMSTIYDAMAHAINDMRRATIDGDIVLVTIITDGYENASKEWGKKSIKALVEEMSGNGWVFTYIGANQDVETVSASLAINNCLAFSATEEGTSEMFEKECNCRKAFFNKLEEPNISMSISENYFEM
ncbi:MAG: hypothetical protein NC339_03585 [Muribaculaceae bacterium]|nr:hypothetical protein [Muribaculaceae bacterium]